MKASENHKLKERTHTLNGEQVERTLKATNFAIMMEATKEFALELVLHLKDLHPPRNSDLKELVLVLNKCKYMSLLSIQNDVIVFRNL
jgi:hypothetical protein